MTTYAGYKADIRVASGTSVAFTDEAMTCVDGSPDYKIWQINTSTKRMWDKAVSIVLEANDGGGWDPVSSADYDVQHCGGRITFHTGLNRSGWTVRVDGNYIPISYLGEAKGWTCDIKRKMVDVAAFGEEWDVKAPLTIGATVKLSRWWVDGWFLTMVDAAQPLLVVILYENDTVTYPRYEGFGYLTGSAANAVRDGILEEDLDVEIDGELYSYTS